MHWFFDPIQKHYSDFKGRTSRKPYWMFILGYFIAVVIVEFIGIRILEIIVSLGLLLPALAIGARRLHDVNKSAWWLLLNLTQLLSVSLFSEEMIQLDRGDWMMILLSLTGPLVLLYFAVQKGDTGSNQYDEDPLGGVATATQAAAPAPQAEQQPPVPPTTPVM